MFADDIETKGDEENTMTTDDMTLEDEVVQEKMLTLVSSSRSHCVCYPKACRVCDGSDSHLPVPDCSCNCNCDQQKFTVSKSAAIQAGLLKTMSEGDKEAEEMPLPNVDAVVLEKVVQYMNHHVNNPAPEIEKPLKSNKMKEVVSAWDADFIDGFVIEEKDENGQVVSTDSKPLFDIILAANYLDFTALLELGCAKVASMMKGKSAEAIRKTFGIVNDPPVVKEEYPIPEDDGTGEIEEVCTCGHCVKPVKVEQNTEMNVEEMKEEMKEDVVVKAE